MQVTEFVIESEKNGRFIFHNAIKKDDLYRIWLGTALALMKIRTIQSS